MVCTFSLFSAVEQFIRAKYERKQYMSRGGSVEASKPTSKETQEQKAKVKPKKASNSSSAALKSSSEQVRYGKIMTLVYIL